MEALVQDSLATLHINPSAYHLILDWMDYGDVLNDHIRNNSVTQADRQIIDSLNELLLNVHTQDDIITYRGVRTDRFSQMAIGDSFSASQFSSVSPHLQDALNYGTVIMRIIIPRGTPAFYVSSWEIYANQEDPTREKEILLLPGDFIYQGSYDGFYNFVYTQSHQLILST